MNLVDFMISGKFGENYSKVLQNYFSTYFDYTIFEIEENGIVSQINLNVVYNKSEIIPVTFEFSKDIYKNDNILTIRSLYPAILEEITYNYKNFVEFLDLFENRIIKNEKLQKLYIK